MSLISSFKKYTEAYIGAVVIVLITAYSLFRYAGVETNGVFVICRIDRYESAGPGAGSDTYCTLFLKDTTYNATVGTGSQEMVGKYYFAKVLKDNPTYEVVVYKDKEVPNCILKDTKPKEGWKEIPICK